MISVFVGPARDILNKYYSFIIYLAQKAFNDDVTALLEDMMTAITYFIIYTH